MNNLTKLIKSVESTEDIEKTFFESKGSLKDIESTKTLTKFRKVVNTFMDNGKIPKENDSLRQNILNDLLGSYKTEFEDKSQIALLSSQESNTAYHFAKDLYCNYLFGVKTITSKQVWEEFKWGVPIKSSQIVHSTFLDLVKRYPKP